MLKKLKQLWFELNIIAGRVQVLDSDVSKLEKKVKSMAEPKKTATPAKKPVAKKPAVKK
jgi:outer membrane murein-binding lipoprotein Lpp